MLQLENPALARLEANELSLGVGIRHARTVDIARIMQVCGFDWLFIDLEHSAMSLDTAGQISMAALDAGISPIVRIPIGDYSVGNRLLDAGAMGIVALADFVIAGGLVLLANRAGEDPRAEIATHLRDQATEAIELEARLAVDEVRSFVRKPVQIAGSASAALIGLVTAILRARRKP